MRKTSLLPSLALSPLRPIGALALTLLVAAPSAVAQRPAPLPKPEKEAEAPQFKPLPKEERGANSGPRLSAPVILMTTDYDCRVELDGEEVAVLSKDVPFEIKVKTGEHLLQAFPIGIEGPDPWKSAVKVPETGKVVQMIELAEIVADWEEEQEKINVEGRFSDVRGVAVRDNENRRVWTVDVRRDMKWAEANRYCSSGSFAGMSGWRLPTTPELSMLYWPDHPEPQFARADPEVTTRLWGLVKKEGEMEVLPVLIYEPFEHNRLSSVWTDEKGVVCHFLGEIGCKPGRRGDALCVRMERAVP